MSTPNHLFNETVTIYKPSYDQDSGGSPVLTYTASGSVACRVQPVRSSDLVQGGRQYSQPVYKFYLDDAVTILMEDRLKYNGDYYNIIEKDLYPGVYCRIVGEKVG